MHVFSYSERIGKKDDMLCEVLDEELQYGGYWEVTCGLCVEGAGGTRRLVKDHVSPEV